LEIGKGRPFAHHVAQPEIVRDDKQQLPAGHSTFHKLIGPNRHVEHFDIEVA
jgi:hypothetical protein